jgi:hypothetical protein
MSPDPQLERLFSQLAQVELPAADKWIRPPVSKRRWQPDWSIALAVLAGLLILVVVMGTQQELRQRAAAPSPSSGTQRQILLYPSGPGENDAWLTMLVPDGWSVSSGPEPVSGRGGGTRAVQISNRPVDSFSTGGAFPQQLDWARLPLDTVVVEVRDICGGLMCMGPAGESAFPLRWADAAPLSVGSPAPAGFEARTLAFRFFLENHVVVAYVGRDASASDFAQVDRVVAGLAPLNLPATGLLHGKWLGVGPFSALPVDEPVFGNLPSPPTTGTGYYVIRHGSGTVAHPMTYQTALGVFCNLAWDSAAATLSCPGRPERWDRFGRGVEGTTRDLDQFTTLTKNGDVYVNFGTVNGGKVELPGP